MIPARFLKRGLIKETFFYIFAAADTEFTSLILTVGDGYIAGDGIKVFRVVPHLGDR